MVLGDGDVAGAYIHSERAESEFTGTTAPFRTAVAIGRFHQDALRELCSMWQLHGRHVAFSLPIESARSCGSRSACSVSASATPVHAIQIPKRRGASAALVGRPAAWWLLRQGLVRKEAQVLAFHRNSA